MKKEILLLSNSPDDASFLAEVALTVQADLKIAANPAEAVDLLAANTYVGTFIDVDQLSTLKAFESELQKKLGLFSERVDPNQMHFLSKLELSENRDVTLSPLFGSYCQRPTTELKQNGLFYGRFITASEIPGNNQLASYLGEKTKVQKLALNHTSQKQQAVEAIRQYLISAKIPARIANIIANAVDEIVMNAMFDAPSDQFGKTLYTATERSIDRELKGQEAVALRIGFDGFYVGISVTDFFGSIDRSRLLNHISANYREKDYTVRQGQAGAGLGLATIFNTGGSLVYHCEAKTKSEVTLLYRAFPSFREFKSQFKFFSAKFYG